MQIEDKVMDEVNFLRRRKREEFSAGKEWGYF